MISLILVSSFAARIPFLNSTFTLTLQIRSLSDLDESVTGFGVVEFEDREESFTIELVVGEQAAPDDSFAESTLNLSNTKEVGGCNCQVTSPSPSLALAPPPPLEYCPVSVALYVLMYHCTIACACSSHTQS